MMRKVRVEEAGDTALLSGAMVDISELKARQRRRRRPQEAGERREDGSELCDATYTLAADGHHQGLAGHGQLPLRRLLPGDDQGADRRPPSRARWTIWWA